MLGQDVHFLAHVIAKFVIVKFVPKFFTAKILGLGSLLQLCWPVTHKLEICRLLDLNVLFIDIVAFVWTAAMN